MANEQINKARFADDPFPCFQWCCSFFLTIAYTPTLSSIPEDPVPEEAMAESPKP